MECPNCQAPNREEANFCLRCGCLLLSECPRCHVDIPGGARFCDHCGLRLVDRPEAGWWSSNSNQRRARSSSTLMPRGLFASRELYVEGPPLPQQGASDLHPSVSTPKPAGADEDSTFQRYIPRELQSKLAAARDRGEMVGERRVVTMLFCDVKGSTAAAEHLDPEEWGEVINGAFEFMIKPVYRYEGIVARMMGDGILAFFGAPIAHEDDPQRAILAGLEIVEGLRSYRGKIAEKYQVDVDVRVGINTGLVVVGAVGSNLRMEYTALGDAINLAARMEQTAEAGTVQVAHDTYKLVRSLFEFEPLGGIDVKGKSEPVPVYRVLSRNSQVDRVRGIEGLQAEMVGREAELDALQQVITNLRQGVGRVVCVLGEAGMGKSRLISEAHDASPALLGGEGNWFETNTLSYETNQAYGVFQRLIRRMADIGRDDIPAVISERLEEVIGDLPLDRRGRAEQVLKALFGLGTKDLGFPLEGETFKRELLEAMREWWLARFSNQPTVLVFDDMHWSDSASVELFLQLLPLTGEIPLVLLVAMREERGSPAWGIKVAADETYHHRFTEISLPPLSEDESNELVNRLLNNPVLPDAMRTTILEKAAGNPFFIEEVVRSLIEGGAVVAEEVSDDGGSRRVWRATSEGAEVSIPDNLRSLLSARLDRLEETTRATLQVASVIGRNFYHRVLQAVDDANEDLDQRVHALLRMEMIRESARVPEIEYTFRNPLTQEAVYKTILLKRRREFHRRVGEAMESIYPDRMEAQYGLLAHHFALAGERDKAIDYARKAAKQAISLYAYDDAVQNLHTALKLIQKTEKSASHLTLLEELGDVYCLLRDGSKAIEMYAQSLELWAGLDTPDPLVEVRLRRKIVQTVTDLKWSVSLEDLQQADEARGESVERLKVALHSLHSEAAHPETLRALVALSADAWRIQDPPDWDKAHEFAQSAVEMAGRLNSPVDKSQALGALESVLDGQSRLREHLQIAERRLEICRRQNFTDLRERLDALRGAGAARLYVGEYAQALPYLDEAGELASRLQAVDQITNAFGLKAQCLYRMDRWDEVLDLEGKWRELEGRYTRERVGET